MALNPRFQDLIQKYFSGRTAKNSIVESSAMQQLPAGNARLSLDFYAATKSRQEACLEHRPTAEACAAGVRISAIQFLGYFYILSSCI
jgi:hypothetical protein